MYTQSTCNSTWLAKHLHMRISKEKLCLGAQERILARWFFKKILPGVPYLYEIMSHGGSEAQRRNDWWQIWQYALEHRLRGRYIWTPTHYEANPLSASKFLSPLCADTVGHYLKKTWVPREVMMMIVFITFSSSLVPLIKGLYSSNPWDFEFSGFRRNRIDNLGIQVSSPSLGQTEPRLHVRSWYTHPAEIFPGDQTP